MERLKEFQTKQHLFHHQCVFKMLGKIRFTAKSFKRSPIDVTSSSKIRFKIYDFKKNNVILIHWLQNFRLAMDSVWSLGLFQQQFQNVLQLVYLFLKLKMLNDCSKLLLFGPLYEKKEHLARKKQLIVQKSKVSQKHFTFKKRISVSQLSVWSIALFQRFNYNTNGAARGCREGPRSRCPRFFGLFCKCPRFWPFFENAPDF